MPNNYQRLKEEADIAAVVDSLQIPVTRRGSAWFLPCPNPGHTDEHATNCYYKDGWNNVYCCACGKSFQAIDLIMFTLSCDYGEAADYLWELEGRPSWYYNRKQKEERERFTLTREEAKLLGLHPVGKAYLPERMHDQKESLAGGREYYQKELDSYLECRVERVRWQDFLTETQYRAVVRNKCRETRHRLEQSLAYFQKLEAALDGGEAAEHTLPLFRASCEEQIQKVDAIAKRLKSASTTQ